MLKAFPSISQCHAGTLRLPSSFGRGLSLRRSQPVAGVARLGTNALPASTCQETPYGRLSSRTAAGLLCRPALPLRRPRPYRPSPPSSVSTGIATTWADEPEKYPQPEQRPMQHAQQQLDFLAGLVLAVRTHLHKLDGLWGKFLPMASLFFLMAFVNTICDSMKDSLVITAVGGGTHVIPYLTVYGVLPISVIFLLLYSWGTQRFSRERLFNIILGFFIAFYTGFGLMYPRHEALHLNGMGDALVQLLPTGLSGLVGMVRNWMFTLFYCVSELWGDVMLSLLFWGLANETTSIEDAPLLYPLFGIGANIAQTMAGRVLRILSLSSGACTDAYTTRVQLIMGLCAVLGICILALHGYISHHFPRNPKGSTAARMAAERAERVREQQQHGIAGGGRGQQRGGLAAELRERVLRGLSSLRPGAGAGSHGEVKFSSGGGKAGVVSSSRHPSLLDSRSNNGASAVASSSSSSSSSSGVAAAGGRGQQQQPAKHAHHGSKKKKKAMSLRDAFDFLKQSPQIRCLAVMALAQGITCNLLDLTFKHHLHKLHTTPAAYSAFLGDTAMWTGIVTGSLMFTSPLLFEKLGWKEVATATPNFMLYTGLPFFAGCVVYNFMSGSLGGVGVTTLKVLVVTGAILQVVSRGAKFSLFKPAEEMVYIGLDDESRTKGKAAIDVVGAQSGKSSGSILQQALLIVSGGTLGGILPILMVLYFFMLAQWKRSVGELGDHYDPSHTHRMSVMGSMDSEGSDSSDPLPLWPEDEVAPETVGSLSHIGGNGAVEGWAQQLNGCGHPSAAVVSGSFSGSHDGSCDSLNDSDNEEEGYSCDPEGDGDWVHNLPASS